jgi:ribosome biogenesis GTPase / thiamine phosphate phosphatase
MHLEDLGYTLKQEEFRSKQIPDSFETGRVVAEHKERYMVATSDRIFEAEITGNMRFTAKSREDFPAVGDWVSMLTYDGDFAIIHTIFPRYSVIKRQAPGQHGGVQIIAANIDFAFLVQSVDRDFNMNRLERYLTICHTSGVRPLIVLSKSDLVNEQQMNQVIAGIKQRIKDVPVIAISNETRNGYAALTSIIEKGKTYCLLGSSGVGKSTLLNNLSGKAFMRTDAISEHTNKGKHVTSHRELIVLENGGIIIDNPGMREVGITDATTGLEITFDTIYAFSLHCKYKDCTHVHESGCAVIEAAEIGEIDKASYENWLKLAKEKAHFELTIAEKRKKEKVFGKILKKYKKDIDPDMH